MSCAGELTSPKVTKENVLKIQGAAGRNNIPVGGSNLNFIERKSFHIVWFKSVAVIGI